MLRELEAIGSRTLISKSIKSPPSSTEEIYTDLLQKCKESHTEKEQEMIAYLFIWLTRSRLSVGAAQLLLNHASELVSASAVVNIQEAAAGRLSK